MRAVITLIADRLGDQRVLFIALGEDGPAERIGQAELRFVPYQRDPEAVARYYQAADVYIHAAKVDTFPNTVLEALACGKPVVATAVGGIPEQVKGLVVPDSGLLRNSDLNKYGMDEATGGLVPAGDAEAMSVVVERLLSDKPLLRRLRENAARDAANRFDLNRQADEYLAWYQEVIARWKIEHSRL